MCLCKRRFTRYANEGKSKILASVVNAEFVELTMDHYKGRMAKSFYAVRQGRVPGVYTTWSDCEKQAKGYGYLQIIFDRSRSTCFCRGFRFVFK